MQRVNSLEKSLMLGGLVDRRREDRGWDGWMASPTRWTWVWVISGNWWWTGRWGVLWFMGSQIDRTKGLYWTILLGYNCLHCFLLSSFLFHLSFICLPNAELATYNTLLRIQPNWCPDIFKCPLVEKVTPVVYVIIYQLQILLTIQMKDTESNRAGENFSLRGFENPSEGGKQTWSEVEELMIKKLTASNRR